MELRSGAHIWLKYEFTGEGLKFGLRICSRNWNSRYIFCYSHQRSRGFFVTTAIYILSNCHESPVSSSLMCNHPYQFSNLLHTKIISSTDFHLTLSCYGYFTIGSSFFVIKQFLKLLKEDKNVIGRPFHKLVTSIFSAFQPLVIVEYFLNCAQGSRLSITPLFLKSHN